MAHGRTAEAALLAWVKTFPFETAVESLADLSDGFVLSKILEDFDPSYAINDLERNTTPSKWLSKKKCLEAVYKSLLRFTSNNCEGLDSLSLDTNIDLNAIAEHDDAQQMVKLLTIFLMAAVNCPNNEKYVKTITTQLDQETTQPEIAQIIQQQSQQSTADSTAVPPPTSQATDLALEEKYAALLKDNKGLKARLETLHTKHETLTIRHDELKEAHYKTDSELRSFRDANDGDQAGFIKTLQAQNEESSNIIASQEQQIEEYRVFKDKMQKELNLLRPNGQRVLELEDEVKVLRTENGTLTKKANMVDHFQRKLEIQSGIQAENTNLRQRIDTLQENQRDFDRVYEENEKHNATFEEYRVRFASLESELVEQTRLQNFYRDGSREQELRIESLIARQASDEKFIEDLQEQIRSSSQTLFSPNSPGVEAGRLTLHEELEQSGDPTPNYLLEISRLKAENQLLRSGSAGTNNATLRTYLDDSERKCKRLEENLRNLTEKDAIAQNELEAVLTGSSHEKYVPAIDAAMKAGPLKMLMDDFYRDAAIATTRDLERRATEELKSTNAKLADVQAQLTSQYRDLLAAKADLAAVDREEIDALEDLKATNEIITSSLQNDLELIQSKHKNLITDYDQQRAHLVEALLDRENLRKEIESSNKVKATVNTERTVEEDHRTTEAQLAEEKEKTALHSLKEQTEKQEMIIQDLQRRLKNAEEAGPDAQKFLKAANEAMMKNLSRENAMIATAWYDLSSRLQSNHLVLQRRQDMPKSWLSKQRLLVNATPRR